MHSFCFIAKLHLHHFEYKVSILFTYLFVDISTLNFGDPSFLVAAAMDPKFKLQWLGEDKDEVKLAITGK